jgi:hypothetical protein
MNDTKHTSRSSAADGGIWFGGALVILGIGFLLHWANRLPQGMSPWYVWPAIVAWAGLLHLFGARRAGEWLWGLLLLVGGTVGQLIYLDLLPFSWEFLWPMLLILAGVGFLLANLLGRRRPDGPTSGPDRIGVKVTMGERKERFEGRAFKGGTVHCVMGGYTLDLRGTLPDEEPAALDVDVFMGGVVIYVPLDWKVEVEATPFMGGIEEKHARTATPAARRLVLRGRVVMGGVEIRN